MAKEGRDREGPRWVHENPWFRVGLLEDYYLIESRQPQVAILPCIGEDFLLVRVHRPLMDGPQVELPAGGCEPGESPAEAARRELAEETGIRVQDLGRFHELPGLSVMPNRFPQLPHLFQVSLTEAEFALRSPHDHEIAEVIRLGRDTLFRWVAEGRIQACLPLAMLFRHFCGLGINLGREDE
jgi:ADP-ribose pyrophosphatase